MLLAAEQSPARAPLYGKAGLPMFVKAGAIIPMMPEMSYVYEKTPEPITLDIYPEQAGTSNCTMYDCETVKSPVKETRFSCSRDNKKIEISTSPSEVAYELWVHCDREPASVVANSTELPRLENKAAYEAAREGWYYGAGCFYGADSIKTLNIKLVKTGKSHLIRIRK
jgi:alpha-glucosidase (family GH31 glycosyl hydrolase)